MTNSQDDTSKTALVLGATGGIGGEVARALLARGWQVRAMHRNAAAMAGRDGLDWVAGDAMAAADVARAAAGANLIVHAVNPPGYRDWDRLVLPMLENTIAAAERAGARILLPGNVYNYGPDAFPLIDEAAPQRPMTVKGRIRVVMEQRLKEAADRRGVRALVVRAGDFFGPRAANNWFSQVLVKPGEPVTAITYPGQPGVGHQWSYLPDLAETMVQLAEREQALRTFVDFHAAGHWDPDGSAMIGAIRRVVGRPDLPVRHMPWALMALASPFVPLFREIREMRYLWREPVRLDGRRLAAVLGAEPHTPLDMAVRETLAGLGCLQDRTPADAGARPLVTVAGRR